jgi:hypothetical protein
MKTVKPQRRKSKKILEDGKFLHAYGLAELIS